MTDFSALGHAFSVHFSIALLITSVIAYFISFVSDKYVIKYQSRLIARWMLWFGAAVALISVVFGLYAYSSVAHDDMSHHLLNQHRNIALFGVLLVIILTLWSLVLFKDDKEEKAGFILVHLIASAALLYVTWSGTLLVYQYGVGVSHLPDSQSHNHRTYKKLTNGKDFFSIIEDLISR